MNDWDQIEASLRTDSDLKPGTINQVWRSTKLARAWLDANEIESARLPPGTSPVSSRRSHQVSGPKNPSQRKTFLNDVVTAAQAIPLRWARRDLGRPTRPCGDKSPLAKAIDTGLGERSVRGRSKALQDLPRGIPPVVRDRGVPPKDCWSGDLAVYKRDRLALDTGHPASTAGWPGGYSMSWRRDSRRYQALGLADRPTRLRSSGYAPGRPTVTICRR